MAPSSLLAAYCMGSLLLFIVRSFQRYELSVSCQKLRSWDESDVTSKSVMKEPRSENKYGVAA